MENPTSSDLFSMLENLAINRAETHMTMLVAHNHCCGQPMTTGTLEYTCIMCGRIETISNASECAAARAGSGKFRGNNEYIDTQYDQLIKDFDRYGIEWTGNAFPKDTLATTARMYNILQQDKTYVKRGSNKDEIIAAILFRVCTLHATNHKRKNIAAFMQLAHGFARGDSEVDRLISNGFLVELADIKITAEGFAGRYLEALNLDSPENVQYVVDLIGLSERRMICMNSNISSKVVGAIWLLGKKTKLGLTTKTLEQISDGTKKNTFMKFVNDVNKFKDIFGAFL